MFRIIIFSLVLFVAGTANVSALDLTLHINKDSVEVNFNWASACSFNLVDTFSMKNAIIKLDVNEAFHVTVINHDSLEHTFTIDGLLENNNTISANSSEQFTVSFTDPGTYRYYSDRSYGSMIGASGIMLVGYQNSTCFFWNLFELNRDLSHELASASTDEIPSDFQPEYFFINGAHFPNTNNDADASVVAQVGDTVIISIVNSGNMEHVLHFHGFHVEMIHSSQQPERIGWIKDTLPLDLGATLTLRLIAHQEGIYPVHDHNLIAVTNAGFYPGGMLTLMSITP